MTNKEKAIGYMKDLGIFDDAIKAFETDDIVFFSINGFIYSLTPQMRQTISEIENKLHSDAVIWHVIHGKYKSNVRWQRVEHGYVSTGDI